MPPTFIEHQLDNQNQVANTESPNASLPSHSECDGSQNLVKIIQNLILACPDNTPNLTFNCTTTQFTDPLIADALIRLNANLTQTTVRINLTIANRAAYSNTVLYQTENYVISGLQVSLNSAASHAPGTFPDAFMRLLTQS